MVGLSTTCLSCKIIHILPAGIFEYCKSTNRCSWRSLVNTFLSRFLKSEISTKQPAMAPRSNKAKKVADTKVENNEMPKKVKGKIIEETEEVSAEIELEEKEIPVEKKKRGRKAVNDVKEQIQANGHEEEGAPPAKKGRKKKAEATPEENGVSDEVKADGEKESAAGTDKVEQEDKQLTNGKGRKKPTKNLDEKSVENGTKESTKNMKKKEIETDESYETKASKSKRKAAQPKNDKPEVSNTAEENGEDLKPEPTSKSRKKAATKSVKEKTPESIKDSEEVTQEDTEQPVHDEVQEKPKKGKGKKPSKKTAKVVKEKSETDEVPNEEAEVSESQGSNKNEEGKGEPTAEASDEEVVEAKPAKGRRGRKAAEPKTQSQESQDSDEPNNKRRRKANEDKATAEDSQKKAPLKNKATTNYEEIDFSNTSKNVKGKEWNLKICSWNVDGIRAWMNKGGLEYIKREKPNILCLQEVKCSNDKLPEEIANLPGYHAYWSCSEQDGYAGVGIYTTKLAMNVQYGLNDKELDNEGRIITAEYEQFYLICTYVPNAGRKLVTLPKRLQWNEAFRAYVKELDKKKPVIICGDMNVAHNEIDLSNPKTNRKNAGFTNEERAGMTDLIGDGFVDTFRHLNPNKTQAYTFWTYMMNCRAKNVGWRLDYFIISERLLSSLCDSTIRDQVYGSDHCPITLFLNFTSTDKPKE